MILFHYPIPTLLALAAVVTTVLGACLKKARPLSYVGGLLWVGAGVSILFEGGNLTELLCLTLALLLLSALVRKGVEEP